MTDFFPTASDTGVTQSDAFALITARTITDTLTFSDSLIRSKGYFRAISTTLTFSDQFVLCAFRSVNDTISVTSTLVRIIIPAPHAPFNQTASRNWIYVENNNKWITNSSPRFTYTTVAD